MEARMTEALALGGGTLEVLHKDTCDPHLGTFDKQDHGIPSSEVSRKRVIVFDMKLVYCSARHGLHFATRQWNRNPPRLKSFTT